MPGLGVVYGRNTAPAGFRASNRHGENVEVLTVSRALPRKRLDVAIETFLHLRGVPCRLTVIGDGPELASLRDRARGLPNVRLLGGVDSDRVRGAYASADICLFPTGYDVFGLVLVEAMGAGLPVIVSSRAGAVADLAASGRNAVVVEGDNPEEWAEAVRALVRDGGHRKALGEAARRTIESRWTVAHSADGMIAGLRLGILARQGVS
jgi:glycosyltransferase involved in cell wall biosynthesis